MVLREELGRERLDQHRRDMVTFKYIESSTPQNHPASSSSFHIAKVVLPLRISEVGGVPLQITQSTRSFWVFFPQGKSKPTSQREVGLSFLIRDHLKTAIPNYTQRGKRETSRLHDKRGVVSAEELGS